jgi:Protein of unknown function (DUF2637).
VTRVDGAVRVVMALAVTCVAAVAAWVSYWHCVEVVQAHGEDVVTARIMPATVDGLVIAASLVLLDCARHHRPAPVLARVMLGVGIVATLAANVSHGVAYGLVGTVVAGWPALALVGTGELALLLVRSPVVVPGLAAGVPDDTDATETTPYAPPERQAGDRLAVVRQIVAADPTVTGTELARRLGVSARTGQRWLTQAMTA